MIKLKSVKQKSQRHLNGLFLHLELVKLVASGMPVYLHFSRDIICIIYSLCIWDTSLPTFEL